MGSESKRKDREDTMRRTTVEEEKIKIERAGLAPATFPPWHN